MERSGDFVLLMGIYEDTSAACRDYQAVKDLCYEINELDQFDAVVVGRQDTGGLKIFKKPLQPAPYAVWAGAGLGLAAGLVVALVPDAATATGLFEGGAAMVGLGAVAAHVSRGLGRKSLEELGEMLSTFTSRYYELLAAQLGRTPAEPCPGIPEVLDRVTAEQQVPGWQDLRELLRECSPDLVVLCTPSGLHSRQARRCAMAGCHVMTEKPMATRWQDGLDMVAGCDEAGVRLFVVKQNRHNATLRMLKDAIAGGRFGRIYMVQVNVFWTRPQEYYDSAAWRGTWDLDGGGALMNQGVHNVDMLLYLMGDALEHQWGTARYNIFLLIGYLGLWEDTMITLAMVISSVFFCAIVGIPLGIMSGRSDRFELFLRPALDAMQTIPPFVYLVPVVMLAGSFSLTAIVDAQAGVPEFIVGHVAPHVSVLNAGESHLNHPTQGLLDMLTIRRHKGRFEDLVVTIIGPSGSGKSTLSAALAAAGWTYLSDELALAARAGFDAATRLDWITGHGSERRFVRLAQGDRRAVLMRTPASDPAVISFRSRVMDASKMFVPSRASSMCVVSRSPGVLKRQS